MSRHDTPPHGAARDPKIRSKTRTGCLTCKVRKKKCDEVQPVCHDCKRFKKRCIWADHKTMAPAEIQKLRQQVRELESTNKLRKRHSDRKKTDSDRESSQDKDTSQKEDKELKAEPIAGEPASVTEIENVPDILQSDASIVKVSDPSLSGYIQTLQEAYQKEGLLTYPENGSKLPVFGFLKELSDFIDKPNLSPFLSNFVENVDALATQSFLPSFQNLALSFNAAFMPLPLPPLTELPDLDETGRHLYKHYVETLSRKVSIAPHSQNESNSYQKVFLPLASKDQATLFGILAWAGYSLGGSYISHAVNYADEAVKLLTLDVDFKLNAACDSRRTILNKLATLLILCGAEICRGDVRYWLVFLRWGWMLLRDNGGILNFDTSKEEHWLISNFAYHDLLSSSAAERGTYFPADTYRVIFKDPIGVLRGNLNPLLGVSKSLYQAIGEINLLLAEKPTVLGELLLEKAKAIEAEVSAAKPDPEDLANLSDYELELQLLLFESFQLSSLLYLKLLVYNHNPLSLDSQAMAQDLVRCVDILIDTPMQATLVFPLFMAGLHMVEERDRVRMRGMMETLIETYGPWNVVRVKAILERVWAQYPDGDRVVNWRGILTELGWEVNFA